jgi:hypothetical protein
MVALRRGFRGIGIALGRTRILMAAALAAGLWAWPFVFGGDSHAIPPPPPPQQAVALLPTGAVWFDAGKVLLIGASGATRTLRELRRAAFSPYVISSSAGSVAVLAGNDLFAGELPGPMTRVPVQRTGCWRAAPASLSTFFVVAPGRLVLDIPRLRVKQNQTRTPAVRAADPRSRRQRLDFLKRLSSLDRRVRIGPDTWYEGRGGGAFSLHLGFRFRTPSRWGITVALLAAAVLCAAVAAGKASGAIFYCNEIVTSGYWCPVHLNVYDVTANINQAYAQNVPGAYVCEKVTITYQAANISYRCGGSPVDSGCDLLYAQYGPGVEWSMYTGNANGFGEYMVGKATHTSTVCA